MELVNEIRQVVSPSFECSDALATQTVPDRPRGPPSRRVRQRGGEQSHWTIVCAMTNESLNND